MRASLRSGSPVWRSWVTAPCARRCAIPRRICSDDRKLRAASRRRAKSMKRILERYFAAMRACDWPALAETLAEDVHRIGPFADEVRGRDAYVEFLAGVIPKLPHYALDV